MSYKHLITDMNSQNVGFAPCVLSLMSIRDRLNTVSPQ